MGKATDILAGVPQETISTTEDVVRSGGAGIRRGLESIPAMPQDMLNLFAMGASWAAGKMGATPEEQQQLAGSLDIPYLPSSEDIHGFTSKVVGPSYEPKTTLGKFAGTIGEFAAGSVGNPVGGMVRHAGRHLLEGVVGGGASEAAGQATEGSRFEPIARMIGGLGGGAATAAGIEGVQHVRTAPQRAAEVAAEDAARAGAPGVQLTRGQRTGSVEQQMQEQLMLRGGRGGWAQRLMQAREDANKQALADAAGGIKDATAPTRGATPVDAGGLLNRQTSTRAEQLRQSGGQQIQSALEQGVMIDADRLRGLPGELSGKLEGSTPFVPDVILDETTPVAKQAMQRVNRFVEGVQDPNVKEMSMAGAEQLRRVLGKLEGSSNTDNRALAKIRQYFDQWYDDAIDKHARVMPDPTKLPGPGGTPDPRNVLASLKAGRQQSKAGLDIVQPINRPPGGKQVADIGSGKQSAEDTARLFKPNDRGDLSGDAIDAITRLKAVGGTSEDLDQIRGIILEQLTTGDPGKVATRVDNFIKNNPTAANALFKPDEIEKLRAWGSTSRSLAPKPGTYNPSAPGIVSEIAKGAGKRLVGEGGILGAIVGGPVGALIGSGLGKVAGAVGDRMNVSKAKEALSPANRDTLAKTLVKGGTEGVGSTAAGSVQAGRTATVDDPGGPNDGKRVRITGRTPKGAYMGELEDGTQYVFGEHTLKDLQ